MHPATDYNGVTMKTNSAALWIPVAVIAAFTVWITARAKTLEQEAQDRGSAITAVGKPAPAFSLPALDGHTVSLADYHGKTLVIAWWASWCTPCRGEIPVLNRLYNRGSNPGHEFEVVAVSVDEDRAAAEAFARETAMTFPVLLDPHQRTIDAYHVESIPSLVVVDPNGSITFGRAGFDPRMQMELAGKLGFSGRFGGMDGRRFN